MSENLNIKDIIVNEITKIDENPDRLTILSSCSDTLKNYLKEQFEILTARDDISEGIECALPFSAESESVEKILEIFQLE